MKRKIEELTSRNEVKVTEIPKMIKKYDDISEELSSLPISEEEKRLLQWLITCHGVTLESVKLHPRIFKGTGRGMGAVERINEIGELLLSIPKAALMSSLSAYNTPLGSLLKSSSTKISAMALLCLHLLFETYVIELIFTLNLI